MDVRTLKLISIPIVFIVNFISGFLPYFLISRKITLSNSKSDHNVSSTPVTLLSPSLKRFLTLANFFSAGVFLSTCIIGLYPGVNNKFDNIIRNYTSNPHPYPFAGLSLALGFFLVWLLEILVHSCIHCHGNHHNHSHSHSHNAAHTSDTVQRSNSVNNNKSSVTMTSVNCSPPSMEDRLLNDEEQMKPVKEEYNVDHEAHSHVPLTGNLMGSVMLTFALGSHSIIEGLGFGVMDNFHSVVSMLITVLIHEAICAISLGINIASRKTPIKPSAILLIIFSMLIPVGIGLGLALDSGLQKNLAGDITVAVLQGVAAGTFIYVVFMEILPNEMSHRKDALIRLVMMVLGFASIAAMAASHSHGDTPLPSSSANQTLLAATHPITTHHSH